MEVNRVQCCMVSNILLNIFFSVLHVYYTIKKNHFKIITLSYFSLLQPELYI